MCACRGLLHGMAVDSKKKIVDNTRVYIHLLLCMYEACRHRIIGFKVPIYVLSYITNIPPLPLEFYNSISHHEQRSTRPVQLFNRVRQRFFSSTSVHSNCSY